MTCQSPVKIKERWSFWLRLYRLKFFSFDFRSNAKFGDVNFRIFYEGITEKLPHFARYINHSKFYRWVSKSTKRSFYSGLSTVSENSFLSSDEALRTRSLPSWVRSKHRPIANNGTLDMYSSLYDKVQSTLHEMKNRIFR